jgi:hypothetical protein
MSENDSTVGPGGEGLRACLAEEWHCDGRGLWARRTCRLWAPHGNRHDFSSWEYNVQPPLRDAAAALPSDPPQTCRDHGPHLGFHWCPECYQRAYAAGWDASRTTLEGALKAKAEEWHKKTAGYSVWDDAADEIDALLSAPACVKCNGTGTISVGGGWAGYEDEPCPDCKKAGSAPAAAGSAGQEKSQLNDGAMEGIAGLRGKLAEALAERDALKVKRDVALRAWKGAAADRDKAQRQVADLRAEVASLKAENERLKQSAVEVAKLNQPNLEQIMALSAEVESLKAKLAAPSAGEGHGSKITRP